MQNNKRVVFMNVSLNIMQQLINTVYTFIIPPLIIINYGSDINGLISSVKQCLVYLALVEAGVGGAAIVALFKPLSEGDRVLQSQIISEAKYFYSKIGVVFIILLLFFSIIYAQIISDQINIILAISLFVIMGLINAVDFLLISKYQVFLTADNKLYVTSATKILTIILDMGCAYILITEGMNIILVQICSVFIYMIRYVIYYFYFLKKYSYISFDLKNKTALLHQKSAVLIHQISGALVFNSPMILITIFLNLKAASIYSIYMLIFMAIKVFLSTITNGMQSVFGRMIVNENINAVREYFSKFEILYFSCLGWFYSCALILSYDFIYLYTLKFNDPDYVQTILIYLFVIIGIADNIRVPGMTLIAAKGHYEQTKYRSIIEALLNIVFSIVFIKIYGLPGVLLGSIISYSYRTIDIIYYSSNKILKQSIIFKMIMLFFLVFFILANYFIVESLKMPFFINDFFKWILYSTFVAVLSALLWLLFYKIMRLMDDKIY